LVGFLGLMFIRQRNESSYDKSVTIIETVFIKWTLVWELFVKSALAEFMKIQQTGIRRCYVTDGLTADCGPHVTSYFDKNQKIMQLHDWGQQEVEN